MDYGIYSVFGHLHGKRPQKSDLKRLKLLNMFLLIPSKNQNTIWYWKNNPSSNDLCPPSHNLYGMADKGKTRDLVAKTEISLVIVKTQKNTKFSFLSKTRNGTKKYFIEYQCWRVQPPSIKKERVHFYSTITWYSFRLQSPKRLHAFFHLHCVHQRSRCSMP